MKSKSNGEIRIYLLFVVSLLLHLAVLFGSAWYLEREADRNQLGHAMVVEYLTGAETRAGVQDSAPTTAPVQLAPPGPTVPAAGPGKDGLPSALATMAPPKPHLPASLTPAVLQGLSRIKPVPPAASDPAGGAGPGEGSQGAAPTKPGSAVAGSGAVGGARGVAVPSPVAIPGGGTPPQIPSTGAMRRRAAYKAYIKAQIEAHKEYPLAAKKSRKEGSCRRRLVIKRDGSLKSLDENSSCGHPFLDEAATRAVNAVGKFPPLPEDFPGADAEFDIEITFTLPE